MKRLTDGQIKDGLAALFEGFSEKSKKEAAEARAVVGNNPLLSRAEELAACNEFENYYLFVTQEVGKPLSAVLDSLGRNGRWKFLFENANSVNNIFAEYFSDTEGSGCSFDKSRWVVSSLLKHFHTGETIQIEVTDKSYWFPQYSLLDQQSILDFYAGIESLLGSGRVDKFIMAYGKSLRQVDLNKQLAKEKQGQ